MKKVWWFLKCLVGLGSIKDGSICWISKHTFLDCHDYPVSKGGTGEAWHFEEYICPKCGREFYI